MEKKKHHVTKTNNEREIDGEAATNFKGYRDGPEETASSSQPQSKPHSGLPPSQTQSPPPSFAKKLKMFGRNIKMSWHTLMVLLWKHSIVRRKGYLATPLEFIIPGIFFFFLILLIPHFYTKPSIEETLIENQVPLQHLADPHLVLFTPDTNFTRSLMSKAGKGLRLVPLRSLPDLTSKGYFGFSKSSEQIAELINHLKSNSAVIVFQDLEGNGTLPQKLTYTIRLREKSLARFPSENQAHTHVTALKRPDSTTFTHTKKVPELYLRIQWEIDSSFIKLHAESEMQMKLRNQRANEPSKSETKLPVVSLSQYSTFDKRAFLIQLVTISLMIIGFISLSVPFIILMTTLTRERTSGIQELLKQAGVTYSVWACSHGMNMIITSLFYATFGTTVLYLYRFEELAINTSFLYNFLNFVLQFHSVLSFVFPLSFLSNTEDHAASIAIIMYILIYMPHGYFQDKELHTMVHVLTGLLPHVPPYWFFIELSYFEEQYKALQFADLFTSHTRKGLSAFMAYLFMILQIILNMLLAEYLSNVAPGKYGVKRPYNYLCKNEENLAATVLQGTEEEKSDERDEKYFEELKRAPSDVGIYVDHVTKIFNNNVTLTNVTFPVYKDEITIFLGHNGAGKTTLMSIIAGVLSPTRGRVFVNGTVVSQDRFRVQTFVGFCSQHILLFRYLSCGEHVRFFAMLKGVSFKQAKKDAKQLLEQLGLGDKQSCQASTLSGGQKRRLQLACALTGHSQILILDEPTAGLDVESRRELWNLLLSLRGSRTVLLSTHMMDEADALGDRVIAMHRGRLKGHATPMYLKKNIESGYRLSLTTHGFPKKEEITRAVQSVIPSTTLKESSYNSVSYNLPSQDSDKFPQLFTKLEGERDLLQIATIGVSVSSLEEVFLMLCSDIDTKFSKDDEVGKTRETIYQKQQGRPLYLHQMRELLKRHWRYIMFYKYTFLVFQVILPILIMAFFIYLFANPSEPGPSGLSDMSSDERERVKPHLLYRGDHPMANSVVEQARRTYDNVVYWSSNNVAEALCDAANFQLLKGSQTRGSNKYVLGVDLNDTHAKLSYSKLVQHAMPVALNLLSNILATQRLSSADGNTITTYNEPLAETKLSKLNEPEAMISVIPVILLVLCVIMCTAMYSVSILTTEQESGTRQIHLMTGCPPAVIWASALLFHTMLYAVIAVIPATLLLLIDTGGLLNQPSYISAFFVIHFVGLTACLVFFYVISFHVSNSKFGICLFLIILLTGLLPGLVTYQTTNEQSEPLISLKIFAFIFYTICPVATTSTALLRATYVTRLNKFCDINLHACPDLLPKYDQVLESTKGYRGFDGTQCCQDMNGNMCIICLHSVAAGIPLLLLFAHIIFYGMIVLLTQYGIFNGLIDRVLNFKYKPLPRHYNDRLVNAEKLYVDGHIYEAPKALQAGEDAMLVSNLHKKYPKRCRSTHAVRGIDFSVKKGECFGLLGVNGAGKSTTFKMITAQEVPTRGTVYTNGHFLKWPRSSKYMSSLGYCPQFSGLDMFMTGRQNLNLLLTLRGLSNKDVKAETEAWIHVVGLERFRDIPVENYSGGCMRRLATACSLSSGGVVTLLDEPTAGVDVSARRRVWVALKRGLRSDRAVVIASNSMDEMEAVCHRIAIMAAGEICAFGSVPQLRADHAAGYALTIKTRTGSTTGEDLQSLKAAVKQTFDCTAKDEHDTMLRYKINQTMHYSELFTKLEAMKQAHPLLEDYSVTETSLEDVFLSFAKPPQKEPETSNANKK